MEDILKSLKQVFEIFEAFRARMTDPQDKAGAILAFQSCYKFAWRSMREILILQGHTSESQKDTIEHAVSKKLITDRDKWLDFKKNNSKIVKVYNARELDKIVSHFESFFGEIRALLNNIEALSHPHCGLKSFG